MDQTGEAWKPEGSALECLCDSRLHREAASSHQAARELLRRRLLQVSTQNDSDDGATCEWNYSSLDVGNGSGRVIHVSGTGVA